MGALQEVFVEKLEGAGGASSAPGDFALRVRRNVRVLPPTLWTQALTEAGQDPEVASYLRRHMREVHDFVAGSIRRSQATGWIDRDRDADAEAWIFLGGMLLLAVADRLGDVLATPPRRSPRTTSPRSRRSASSGCQAAISPDAPQN